MRKRKKTAFDFKHVFTKAEEKEEVRRMLAGELFAAWIPSLYRARRKAKTLCHKLNKTSPAQRKLRRSILRKLFGKTGNWIMVEPPFNCDYGYNIEADNFFYANVGCVILDCNKVIIGKNVMFGPGVHVYSVNHPVNAKERMTYKEFGLPVKIGDRVWIGGNSTILPGVTIGDDTTIGAGSVVAKSIPANCLAVGNPCRVVRRLTPKR